MSLKHFTFKQRLLDKSRMKNGCNVIVCTEEFTSKTCTRCGNIDNNLGSNEIYKCGNCKLVIDRDINASRNIYMKQLKEVAINSQKFFESL